MSLMFTILMLTILIFIFLHINLKLKYTAHCEYAQLFPISQCEFCCLSERMTDFCMNRQGSGEDDNIYFITDLTHKN